MKTIVLILFCGTVLLTAQQSGPAYYKSAVMDGNNVKTVFSNWGVIGQPTDSRPRGAWKIASNGYIGDNSLMIGVEFPIRDYTSDGKVDTIHSVITTPVARPAKNPDTDPSGNLMTFMPVSGLHNPDKHNVAMSNDPTTWPASWGGAWKGINGNGVIIADLETYFQMDDQNDLRFSSAPNNPAGIVFQPDTVNSARKGQGIRVDVRYLQFNHPLFSDILFRVYDIINESSFEYQKMFLGYLQGTYIGLTGTTDFKEYDDDYSVLYKKEHVVISGDFPNNNSRNPFWSGPVGKFGEAFLQSEGNGAVGGYVYYAPAGSIDLRSDEELWNWFIPGNYKHPSSIINDTTVLSGEDGDYTVGTQYFSIPSKGKKRIASAIAFGYTESEILQKILLGKVLSNNNFQLQQILSQNSLPQFATPVTLSGNTPLTWPVKDVAGTVDIYFSEDAGSNWKLIGESLPDNGTFNWNTALNADCAFGKLRVFYKDTSGAYVSVRENEKYITINNSGNGRPFVHIITDLNVEEPVTVPAIDLNVLAGDPDNAALEVTIAYSLGQEFIIAELKPIQSVADSQNIQIDLSSMPNGAKFKLKLTVTDGVFSWTDSTEYFQKSTQRNEISPSDKITLSGNTDAITTFSVVDKAKTTTDSYIISFIDTAIGKPKTFSVFNETKSMYTLKNVELINQSESPVFDGVRMHTEDPQTGLDTSFWKNDDSAKSFIWIDPIDTPWRQYGYPLPSDYQIIFGINGMTINLVPYLGFATPVVPTSMIIKNISTNIFPEFYCDTTDKHFYDFYLVENILGIKRATWHIGLISDTGLYSPKSGDTLTVITVKGLSYQDTIQINNIALKVDDRESGPAYYELSQNYPNPFNPSTAIEFSLGRPGMVSIKVFDILGREIASPLNEHRTAGRHLVQFDASALSSGIYFYRISSGDFVDTKKMVLIR